MRERRRKALDDWEAAGNSRHCLSDVDAFIKRELVAAGKYPHIIGSRNDVLQCLLGPVIAAIEPHLSKVPGARCISANSLGKGRYVEEALFMCHKALEVDFTAWDSTVSQFDLQLTHSIYTRLFSSFCSPWITIALAAHATSKWSYRDGCRYTLIGTRVSGDPDTTVGNTIIHWCYNQAFLGGGTRPLYPWLAAHHHFEVAGDDGVMGLPDRPYDLSFYTRCGKDAKPIPRPMVDDATFCSGVVLPVVVGGVVCPRLYRVPGRSIGRLPYTSRVVSRRFASSELEARALSEIYASSGLPVVFEYARLLFRSSCHGPRRDLPADRDVARRLMLEQSVPLVTTVDSRTRESFAHLFDVDISTQIQSELRLAAAPPWAQVHCPVLNHLTSAHT